VVNALYRDLADVSEERDGFHIGLDGSLGVRKSLADNGFITLFPEGQGSLPSDVSHLARLTGIRIRFDRLGTGG
jgi:hypothetical protein